MPKISQIFRLGKTQRELDFIDIDPSEDTPVFINPFDLSNRNDHFSISASRTVKSFFDQNLSLIRNGKIDEAKKNFRYLHEPNETCLGMSREQPQGRGMGPENSDDLFESIVNSPAVASGLLEHIEDTAIFIPGIGRDKVSDMTTNIIRLNLIEYTQSQCDLLNIEMTPDVPSGFYWDIGSGKWNQVLTRMLVIEERKILFVPKGIVSYVKEFTPGKYHRYYALTFLQDDHLRRNTTLVRERKDKDGKVTDRFVTKKDLIEKILPADKIELSEFTARHPEVFSDFRNAVAGKVESIPNDKFDDIDERELVDHLLTKLRAINSGQDGASDYHKLMIGILEFIFYPDLIHPVKEHEINDGRKRIDITFDNAAKGEGFIHRVQSAFQLPCPFVFFECKNYSRDVANPELDQMVGRFSPNRGKFGMIVCRDLQDEDLFIQRCKDSYKDQHGLIIPLTDRDIESILIAKKDGDSNKKDEILSNKARLIAAG